MTMLILISLTLTLTRRQINLSVSPLLIFDFFISQKVILNLDHLLSIGTLGIPVKQRFVQADERVAPAELVQVLDSQILEANDVKSGGQGLDRV